MPRDDFFATAWEVEEINLCFCFKQKAATKTDY